MLKANEARPQLALVTWTDSSIADIGWEHLEGMKPLLPTRVVSIGWIIDETGEYITLAGDISDTQVLGRRAIPKFSLVEPVKRFTAPWPKQGKKVRT